MRATLIEELVSEVTVNIRLAEHRVKSLVPPTELVEPKCVWTARLPQVEYIYQIIRGPLGMLQ